MYPRLPVFPNGLKMANGSKTAPKQHGRWVGGHWVGLLWLAYASTNDPSFATAAREWGSSLLPQLNDQADHDLGFLFELGFILGYQLTGDSKLKPPALQALCDQSISSCQWRLGRS